MTYYNPENGQTMGKQMLQNHLNASFPEGTPEILGWHLVNEEAKRPQLENGQKTVKDEIVLENGQYFQTYSIVENEAISQLSGGNGEDNGRIAILERAVAELAQMVSNFEDYRVYNEGVDPSKSRISRPEIVPEESLRQE